jgi:hypothetical protein
MKLWSSLFTSAVVVVGVTACAMDPSGQGDRDVDLGQVSQPLCKQLGDCTPTEPPPPPPENCKAGAACYPGSSSSGDTVSEGWACPRESPRECGALHLTDRESPGVYQCEEFHCPRIGPGDGYYIPYNPCGLWKTYSCTWYGVCTCN